jgi:hypothetical protein
MSHDNAMDRADLFGRVRTPYSVTARLAGDVPEQLMTQLHAIAALAPNWDSNEAPAISQGVRARASEFVRGLYRAASALRVELPEPRAFPSSDGSLGFLWANRDGQSDLEVLVTETGLEAIASTRGEVNEISPGTDPELEVLSLVLSQVSR